MAESSPRYSATLSNWACAIWNELNAFEDFFGRGPGVALEASFSMLIGSVSTLSDIDFSLFLPELIQLSLSEWTGPM